MAISKLPHITAVASLTTTDRAAILDLLFEPCTALHTLSVELLHNKVFSSYDDLINSIAMQLKDLADSDSTSDTEWLEKILGAHPRLGEKNVESEQSKAEQAQLSSGAGDQAQELARLNADYERVFPGLKYVVFVNGRDRSAIMQDMRLRIERADVQLERAAAIKAMSEIATDRARKLNTQ